MDTYQNPSLLGFQHPSLDFVGLLAWISIRLVTWGATNQDMLQENQGFGGATN